MLKVHIQGKPYNYYARSATSYSSVDLNMTGSGSVSAFLEAQDLIMYLQLRATTRAQISYTPSVFFRVKSMLECELQFTAPEPRESAVLAVRLLNAVAMIGCHLFTGFKNTGQYPSAISRNGYGLKIIGSVIDIDGTNTESWFKDKSAGNLIYDGV